MPRHLLAPLCATLLLLQPLSALAQDAHTAGAPLGKGSGKATAASAAAKRPSPVLGTAAAQNTGTSGATVPLLNAANFWGALQVGCWNSHGCVSPRIGAVFNAIGPLAGENNQFDAVAYDGFSQFVAERYDRAGGKFGVGANEVVGGFFGAAQDSTGSDPVDAGMMLYTTEAQAAGHNGMGLELDYTPNGSTALSRGLSVSPQGKGGVTIGGGFASNNPYNYAAPADLGQGTVNAAAAYYVNGHQIADSSGRLVVTTTVAASNCGSLPGSAGCIVVNVSGDTHYVPYW